MERKVGPVDFRDDAGCTSPPPAYGGTSTATGQTQQPHSSGEQAPQNTGATTTPPAPCYTAYPCAQQAWGPTVVSAPSYYVPQPGQPLPAAYYPAPFPGMAYPGPPPQYAFQPMQQQQQQHVVMFSARQDQVPMHINIVESYCGQIAFSCFVFWCCNCLFGLVAFILALIANTSAVSDPHSARKLGRASWAVSVTGITVTVVVVIVAISVANSAAARENAGSCGFSGYSYAGLCYDQRSRSYSRVTCPGAYDAYRDYCYYNRRY